MLLMMIAVAGLAADAITIDPLAKEQNLSTQLQYFEDQQSNITITDLIKAKHNFPWQTQLEEEPNFGYNTNPYWFYLPLENNSREKLQRLLSVGYPLLDQVDIYQVVNNELVQQWQLGDTRPFTERPIYNRNFIVPLNISANSASDIYLRIQTTSSVQLPLVLYESNYFYRSEFMEAVTQFLFYGGLFVMAIYNLFIFISVRSISYLFYVCYVCAVTLLYLAVQGYGFQLLWPNDPWINSRHITVLSPASLLLGTLFAISFLNTKKYSTKLYYYQIGLLVVIALSLILGFILPYAIMIKPALLISMWAAISILVSGILVWRAGNKSAHYFNLAWCTLLISIVIYDMNKLGLLPRNVITENGMQLGVLLEVLLLSFALADRINRERKEKFEAQKLAIHNENLAREEKEKHLQTKLKAEVDELKAKEAAVRAQAESKAKSDFLAAMSHEIRTPMNGVIGMCEMLKQVPLDNQAKYYVDIIDSSGRALLTLINDILDYSKIEAGKMEIETIDFDLNRLMNDVCSVFELTAQKKDLTLQSNVDSDTPVLLKGDPNRLRQILLNLMGNAFKFTKQGGVTLTVKQVSQSNANRCLRFSVEDTGIGISEEGRQKLFSDFSQANRSTSRMFGGTGLGLSISKKLVHLMGGDIGVESEAGQGSCFWFTIQCQLASADFNPGQTQLEDHEYQQLEHLKVLVAEDNTVNQLVISSMLKKLGVDIAMVDNGEKAVEFYRSHHKEIDLVLMDCEMPVMDGYTACRAIRQFEHQQELTGKPIFALSAHAMSEHQTKSLQAGMSAHITKPIEFNHLYHKIANL